MLIAYTWLATLIPDHGIVYWLYAANFILGELARHQQLLSQPLGRPGARSNGA